MGKAKVAILKVTPKNVVKETIRLCELAGLDRALDPKAATVLRDELAARRPMPAANSTPWQIEGALAALTELGFAAPELVRADRGDDADALAMADAASDSVLRRHGVKVRHARRERALRWVEYLPKARMHALGALFPRGIFVPDDYFGKNLLHLPTLKTDVHASVAGAAKNALDGVLRAALPDPARFVHRALVDALAIEKELTSGSFAIIDGTTAGNGPGPFALEPVVKDVMLASDDLVALDAVAAKLMGFDPLGVEFIRLAHDDGLGVGDPREIDLVGDDTASFSTQSWGFSSRGRGGGALALVASGPLSLAKSALLRTPLAGVVEAGREAFADRYRWPLQERRTFERWQRDTSWGRTFAAYAHGQAATVVDLPAG